MLSLWWHIRQTQFLFFMCRNSKCHINSWLLLFLAARGQFCFIWPFALLPHQHHHLIHSLSLALIHSPSCVPPSAEAPPALCCDRLVRLAFGRAVCSAGRQPAQCVEPRGCAEYLRVSSSFSLSGWLRAYWGHRHHRITQHLLPLTSLQPGELTHTHIHTNCPFARCSHSTTFGSAVACATIDPWLHLSVWIDSSRGTLRLSHSVVFNIRADGRSGSPLFSHFVILYITCCNTVFWGGISSLFLPFFRDQRPRG